MVFENFFWISIYKSLTEAFLSSEVRLRPIIGLAELLEKVDVNLGWTNVFTGLSLSNFYNNFLVLPKDKRVFLLFSKELRSVVRDSFLSKL